MTEENKSEESPSIENVLSDMQNKLKLDLDTKMSSQSEKLDNLESLLKETIKKEPEEENDFDLGAEGDEYITQRGMLDLLKKWDQKVEEKIDQKAKKVSESVYEGKRISSEKDMQTFRDFPILNQNSPQFNKEFMEDTQKMMKEKVSIGRNAEDPDLLYDSAAVVWNNWLRQGRVAPENVARMMNQTHNNNEDISYSGTGQKPKNDLVTEGQLRFAKSVGLNPDRYRELRKKYKK